MSAVSTLFPLDEEARAPVPPGVRFSFKETPFNPYRFALVTGQLRTWISHFGGTLLYIDSSRPPQPEAVWAALLVDIEITDGRQALPTKLQDTRMANDVVKRRAAIAKSLMSDVPAPVVATRPKLSSVCDSAPPVVGKTIAENLNAFGSPLPPTQQWGL